MMVVDSSAIIAILFEEPEGPDCTKALEGAASRLISAVNYVETGTVLVGRLNDKRRSKAIGILDEFLVTLGIDIVRPANESANQLIQRVERVARRLRGEIIERLLRFGLGR